MRGYNELKAWKYTCYSNGVVAIAAVELQQVGRWTAVSSYAMRVIGTTRTPIGTSTTAAATAAAWASAAISSSSIMKTSGG